MHAVRNTPVAAHPCVRRILMETKYCMQGGPRCLGLSKKTMPGGLVGNAGMPGLPAHAPLSLDPALEGLQGLQRGTPQAKQVQGHTHKNHTPGVTTSKCRNQQSSQERHTVLLNRHNLNKRSVNETKKGGAVEGATLSASIPALAGRCHVPMHP